MSKKAAEHHKKASEHLTHAARHHGEAAKQHEAALHEKAAHHAHTARAHVIHARFADKTTRATHETSEGSAAAEEAGRGIEQSYSAAAESIRDFNLRLIETAQANALATLDFAQEISTAKGPSEAMALWSSHARKQFERLTEQSKELTAFWQKIATLSAEPITRSFGQTLKAAS
jgi:phasin